MAGKVATAGGRVGSERRRTFLRLERSSMESSTSTVIGMGWVTGSERRGTALEDSMGR